MSVNTVFLVGRLGAPPELRTTGAGKAVCSFSVATDRWDAKASAKTAEWHAVVVWEKAAENCHRYLAKGSQVAVEGRLATRKWDAPDGKPRYKTEVVAHRVHFLTRADAPAGGGASPAPWRGSGGPAAAPGPPAVEVDDDLPF